MKKKLLTFLGSNPYQKVIYHKGDFEVDTRFVQEALLELLGKDLEVTVFLTELSKKKNWFGIDMEYDGLKKILDEKGISYKEVDIYDGKNNEEVWKNFDIIYDTLMEEDEIYIDITHSFRSIPIIFMSVLNYAKFTKNVNIKGIFYGAFEAKKENRAPIFDLTLFNKITEWAIGAEKLISTGDGEIFSDIIHDTISPILRETKGRSEILKTVKKANSILKVFSYDLKSSRGIIIPETGFELKKYLLQLKNIEIQSLKPFEKIIEKILDSVKFYTNEDIISDIHHTIRLCRDYKLIQQGFTLLSENIINYVCLKADLPINNKKVRGKSGREIAKDILFSFNNDRSQLIKLNNYELELKKKLSNYLNHEMADFYLQVSDFRNDLNHGGYRLHPIKYDRFIEKLDEYINKFEILFLVRRF